MSRRTQSRRAAVRTTLSPTVTTAPAVALPLGAMLLAGSMSALAQQAPTEATLQTVTVTEQAEAPEGKDSVRATETAIGKGKQQLRDIPQSVTVVTERLIDDRNLDTVKEALKNTAGITFLAAEGGEEDIRLRGFALQATGDLFIDGMRDPAIYDRDTFNMDRMELLRGSASMLFGRGSTGGAVSWSARPIDSRLPSRSGMWPVRRRGKNVARRSSPDRFGIPSHGRVLAVPST